MKKSTTNLLLCSMIFAVALVVANVITAKTVQTGFSLFGSSVLVPSAVICYCITFLMTDVIGEIWGAKEARTVVLGGFVCQIIATLLIIVAQVLPAGESDVQLAYETLLGQNALFVFASMAGYLLSQSWDVFVFHRLRNYMLRNNKSYSMRWLWNNLSTMSSQAVDTLVFIGLAFGVGMGWLFDVAMLPQLAAMILGQYACKFLLAIIDTPVFYFLTRKQSSPKHEEDDSLKGNELSFKQAGLKQPEFVLTSQSKQLSK